MKSSSEVKVPRWRLVTNHGHVLVCIATAPDASRLRDIAEAVGITERTAAQIVNELEDAGYITKIRDGRRNRYQIDGKRKIPTPRLATITVAELLSLVQQALEQQPLA